MEGSKKNLKEYLETEGLIFPKEPIKEFYSQIFKLSGFGIGGIMNISGKKAGSVGAKIVKKMIDNEEELKDLNKIFSYIKEFFEETNICKNITFKTNNSDIEFFIENSIFAEAVSGSKKPVCIPLSGAVSGFLEEITGEKWECKETSCMSQGHEKCSFSVKRKKSIF